MYSVYDDVTVRKGHLTVLYRKRTRTTSVSIERCVVYFMPRIYGIQRRLAKVTHDDCEFMSHPSLLVHGKRVRRGSIQRQVGAALQLVWALAS